MIKIKIHDLINVQSKIVLKDTIIFDKKVRTLCMSSYEGHKNGCPNYNKKDTCPTNSLYREDILESYNTFILVYATFNFAKYKAIRKEENNALTQKQIACLLYWQGAVKKDLKDYIKTTFSYDEVFGCGSGFLNAQSMESAGMLVLDMIDENKTTIKKGIYSLNNIEFEQHPKNKVVLSALLCFKTLSHIFIKWNKRCPNCNASKKYLSIDACEYEAYGYSCDKCHHKFSVIDNVLYRDGITDEINNLIY